MRRTIVLHIGPDKDISETINADLNGARNIARLGNALIGGLPVNEPIVACHDIKPRNLVEHSYKPSNLFVGN